MAVAEKRNPQKKAAVKKVAAARTKRAKLPEFNSLKKDVPGCIKKDAAFFIVWIPALLNGKLYGWALLKNRHGCDLQKWYPFLHLKHPECQHPGYPRS